VRLLIFDARGRLTATLVNETMAAGVHEASWSGRNDAGAPVASGVYFYKLESGGYTESKRMVLLK
jgi:flagellar hook assembly protein FlgD